MTKFSRPTPRYDIGGLIADFGKSGAASAGMNAIGSNKAQEGIVSNDTDDLYKQDIAKTGGTNRTIDTFSNAALSSGNPYLMAAGAIGKVVTNVVDFDKGAKKKAMMRLETRKTDKALDASSIAGAKNINALPAYKAPVYGRRGAKLKKSPPGFRMGGMSFTSKFAKPC